nr:hypothetical protein [Rhizobium leguminosarum]
MTVGALTLRNRIIIAPLTRMRAGVERVPNAIMAEYSSDQGCPFLAHHKSSHGQKNSAAVIPGRRRTKS